MILPRSDETVMVSQPGRKCVTSDVHSCAIITAPPRVDPTAHAGRLSSSASFALCADSDERLNRTFWRYCVHSSTTSAVAELYTFVCCTGETRRESAPVQAWPPRLAYPPDEGHEPNIRRAILTATARLSSSMLSFSFSCSVGEGQRGAAPRFGPNAPLIRGCG